MEYFHTYRNTWKSATDGFVSMAIDILESASLILPTKCNCMAYERKACCEKIKWFPQQIHVCEFNYYILPWDNLVLSPGLIMWTGHCKENRKLMFWALALRRSKLFSGSSHHLWLMPINRFPQSMSSETDAYFLSPRFYFN